MFKEALDPLRSKSLTLHLESTLLEFKFRHVGLNPQLPPVKASTISLYSTCNHPPLPERQPHPIFYPFKRPQP